MNKALELLAKLDDVLDIDMILGTEAQVSFINTGDVQLVFREAMDMIYLYRQYQQAVHGYTIVDGIITDPGKFEGEPHWVPYFWELYLTGGGDDDGELIQFTLGPDDYLLFPELTCYEGVGLYVTSDGFVRGNGM